MAESAFDPSAKQPRFFSAAKRQSDHDRGVSSLLLSSRIPYFSQLDLLFDLTNCNYDVPNVRMGVVSCGAYFHAKVGYIS